MDKKFFYDELNQVSPDNRFEEFKNWCLKEGVLMPKLDLKGDKLSIKEQIPNREAFLFVPYKMIISVNKTLMHEVLGPIIDNHPEVFDED